MKTLIIFSLLLSFNVYAQKSDDSKKDSSKKEEMDYGDKQLLKRDTCRKPIEYLETRYPNKTKEELEKMMKDCSY